MRIMNTSISKKYFIHILKPNTDLKDFEFVLWNDIQSVPESSAESIYIHDLLDYVDETSVGKTIRILKSKLANNGKLYIQGTDIKSASASLLYGQINIKIFKSMVYGIGKKSTYTISDIREILNDIDGIKILSIDYINASQYYIECLYNE